MYKYNKYSFASENHLFVLLAGKNPCKLPKTFIRILENVPTFHVLLLLKAKTSHSDAHNGVN